jgi:hypothetical protein
MSELFASLHVNPVGLAEEDATTATTAAAAAAGGSRVFAF